MKVVPVTVGGFAGGTVYPRSPLRTVPAPVLVYVLARIAKLLTPVRFEAPAEVKAWAKSAYATEPTMVDEISNRTSGVLRDR